MSIRFRDMDAILQALEIEFGVSNGDVWRVESITAGKSSTGVLTYFVVVYVVGDDHPFQTVKITFDNQGVATLTVPASNTSDALNAVITTGTVTTAGAITVMNDFLTTADLDSYAEGPTHI
jgi:hypothetical protein